MNNVGRGKENFPSSSPNVFPMAMKALLFSLIFLLGASCAQHPSPKKKSIPHTPEKSSTPVALANAVIDQPYDGWFPRQPCDPSEKLNFSPRAKEYEDYYQSLDRSHCYKDWTVLVYMAADNDLTPYAYWDLYEMEAGNADGLRNRGSTEKSDLLVHVDLAHDEGTRVLHIFQQPEPYDLNLGLKNFREWNPQRIRSPVVLQTPQDLRGEEQALGFLKFLEFGMKAYPSKHYMVVIWGHGEGWAPGENQGPTPDLRFLTPEDLQTSLPEPTPSGSEDPFEERKFGGIAFDDSQKSYLDIPTVGKIFSILSERLLGGKPIDVYASDACLMQMLEVATELAPKVGYIIGSANIQNFLGLPYREMMGELNSGSFGGMAERFPGADEGYWMAKMVPPVFAKSFQEGLQGRVAPEAVEKITLASLSSRELLGAGVTNPRCDDLQPTVPLSGLLPELRCFSRATWAYLKENPLRKGDLLAVMQQTPGFLGGAKDLGSFLGWVKLLIYRESEITGGLTPAAETLWNATERTLQALDGTVLGTTFGSGYNGVRDHLSVLGFRAVSVWLPYSKEEWDLNVSRFRSSQYYHRLGGDWETWIRAVFEGP